MPGVRDRNESAWLLPNDGSRTNHRLRADMRRFADTDEIDPENDDTRNWRSIGQVIHLV